MTKTYSLDDKLSFKQGDTVRVSFVRFGIKTSSIIPGKIVGKSVVGDRDVWIVDFGQPLNTIDTVYPYPFSCMTTPTNFIINENV